MSEVSDLERRCADLEELLARERVARKLAQDEARVNSIALRVLAREVRAPLDGALEWARMLQREMLSKNGRDHAMRVVERHIEGSMRMIDDLVVNVASTPPRPAQLQLDETVLAAHVAVSPRINERKLSCVLDLAAVTIYADARRTERVVQRFLETAVGLANEGTELRIVLTSQGLSGTFDTELELPALPLPSWDQVSAPVGIAQPHLVNLFLLQQLAAARGARLELHQGEERKTTLHLVLLHGQTEHTVPFSDHELRTPLQILTVGVELLRTRVRDSADDVPREWVLERLDALEQAVDHLTAAVERLSAFAHSAPLRSRSATPPP
jgi:signal transduction histidine kinase